MCEKLWSPPLVLLVFHMHHLLDFTPSFTQDCQPFSFAVPSRTKNSTEKSVAESSLSVILSTIIFIDSSMFNLSARSHSSYWSLDLYVHCCLVTQSCLTLCDTMDSSTPGFLGILSITISHSLPKFMSIELYI